MWIIIAFLLFCHSRESGNPGSYNGLLNTLDSRFRGNDENFYFDTISTNVPLLPGIAPETYRTLSAESTCITLRFLTVILSPPIRPAILMPTGTRVRRPPPIEPGSRSECFCPWERGPPPKP